MRTLLVCWIFLFTDIHCWCQSTEGVSHKNTLLYKGYHKEMSSYSHYGLLDQGRFLQLIHNRINIFWQPDSAWEINLELRNRLYLGQFVREQSDENWLINKKEAIKLHKTWIHRGSWIFHSNVERFSIKWTHKKLALRVGRQRINWGLTTTWNPNDIFNTYSFLDFDYEERPGVDALKINWNAGQLSSVESVVALASRGQSIAGIRYFFNKNKFDYQLLGGYYLGRSTLGIGWAGEIKGAGFKGEAQYFFNHNGLQPRLTTSIELDYVTGKEWYLITGILLNSLGLNHPVLDWSKISFELSPENMMPGKWNGLLGFKKQWHPLWTGGLTMVYAPGIKLLLGIPSIQYNFSDRIDLDLVGQHFFGQQNNRFSSINQSAFLRLKYSF